MILSVVGSIHCWVIYDIDYSLFFSLLRYHFFSCKEVSGVLWLKSFLIKPPNFDNPIYGAVPRLSGVETLLISPIASEIS